MPLVSSPYPGLFSVSAVPDGLPPISSILGESTRLHSICIIRVRTTSSCLSLKIRLYPNL